MLEATTRTKPHPVRTFAVLQRLLSERLPEARLSSLAAAWDLCNCPPPELETILAVQAKPGEWRRLWPVDLPLPREADEPHSFQHGED